MGLFLKKGSWYIDYYVEGRRRRELIGPNKKLAQSVLHKRKAEIAEGKFLDKRQQEEIIFSDFAEAYFKLHSRQHKRSYKSDKANIKQLNHFFGNKYLHDITPMLVEKYKIERGKKTSKVSVNRQVALLKHMFTKAVEWGKMSSNPIAMVKLYKENNNRIRFLEKEEMQRLICNCEGLLKAIVIVALNTGMRRGEIFNLKWADIDLRSNIINIYESKSGKKGEIPMNKLVIETLKGIRKRKNSPYVFCRPTGKNYRDIRKSFLTACKKSDILDFRFHDLRHSFCSHLVMSGVDLRTVKELMRHAKIETTMRYSHLSPNHKSDAVECLVALMCADVSRG